MDLPNFTSSFHPAWLLHVWHPVSIALVVGMILAIGVATFGWFLLSQKKRGREEMGNRTDLEAFRTPLTVILGAVDQLQQGDTENATALELIRTNSQYVLQLLERKHDRELLAEGRLQINPEQDDIIQHIRQLVNALRFQAEQAKVELDITHETKELVMDFDRVRLVHVLSGLLTLAVRESGTGERIDVRVEAEKTPGFLTVEIAPSDPNVHALWTSTDLASAYNGDGIDYTFLQELIKLMGGRLQFSSDGKSQQLHLPVTRRDLQKVATPKQTATSRQSSEPVFEHDDAPIILIVEDNADLVSLLSQILGLDYNLLIARNGQEGIEQAVEQIPDIIITDVMMPQKDGYELSYTLKNHELTSHIPIIMMSARTGVDSRVTGMRQGADVYLEKPFQPEELETLVSALLEQRKRLQAYYLASTGLSEEVIPKPDSAIQDQQTGTFLRKLQDLITEHLEDEDLSVDKLSQLLFMDSSNLYRKVTALTGLSPIQYIQSLRIKKAKELLKDPKLPILEVALSCGFNSSSYFSRAFKKEIGQSPSQYRKAFAKK